MLKIYKFESGEKVKIAPVMGARLITEKERNFPTWTKVLKNNDYRTSLLLWSENRHTSGYEKYNEVAENLKQNGEINI